MVDYKNVNCAHYKADDYAHNTGSLYWRLIVEPWWTNGWLVVDDDARLSYG